MSGEDWVAGVTGVIAPLAALFTLNAMNTNNATQAAVGAVATLACAGTGLYTGPGLFGTISGYTLAAAFFLAGRSSTSAPSTMSASPMNTPSLTMPMQSGNICDYSQVSFGPGADGKAEIRKPADCVLREIPSVR